MERVETLLTEEGVSTDPAEWGDAEEGLRRVTVRLREETDDLATIEFIRLLERSNRVCFEFGDQSIELIIGMICDTSLYMRDKARAKFLISGMRAFHRNFGLSIIDGALRLSTSLPDSHYPLWMSTYSPLYDSLEITARKRASVIKIKSFIRASYGSLGAMVEQIRLYKRKAAAAPVLQRAILRWYYSPSGPGFRKAQSEFLKGTDIQESPY